MMKKLEPLLSASLLLWIILIICACDACVITCMPILRNSYLKGLAFVLEILKALRIGLSNLEDLYVLFRSHCYGLPLICFSDFDFHLMLV